MRPPGEQPAAGGPTADGLLPPVRRPAGPDDRRVASSGSGSRTCVYAALAGWTYIACSSYNAYIVNSS